jgi:hypothetical protein
MFFHKTKIFLTFQQLINNLNNFDSLDIFIISKYIFNLAFLFLDYKIYFFKLNLPFKDIT